jgi:TonB family protein
MKKCFLLYYLVFNTICAFGQKTEQYFTWNWKPCALPDARFVAITEKQDSLWHRKDYYLRSGYLQMEGHYHEAAAKVEEGVFQYYHANGQLQSTGAYRQGKKEGTWISYHPNGLLSDSVIYQQGNVVGTRLRFYANGYMLDSSIWKADGSGIQVSWFDNGNPSQAGYYAAGSKQHGKWQYFHTNGKVSALEVYDQGALVNKSYFGEDGQPLTDTTNRDIEALFPGGDKAWANYLYKNLYFPTQFQITNSDKAVVVVDWVVDEEGRVGNVNVYSSFHPEFDKIAVKIIQNSPKWKPAVQHNRKIKAYRRQPITFQQ